MLSKSAHMHLINDGVLHLSAGKIGLSPYKTVPDDPGMIGARRFSRSPGALPGHCPGIGIKDQLFAVKKHVKKDLKKNTNSKR